MPDLNDACMTHNNFNLSEGTTASTTSVSVGSSRSGGGRAGSGDSGPTVSVHPPPPPPVHRYPSWEDRIYRIANEGMNASTEEVAFGAGSDSRNNNSESRLSANFGGGFGEDISVPVYATIKGVSLNFRIKSGSYSFLCYRMSILSQFSKSSLM